jgi:hypothetical protein
MDPNRSTRLYAVKHMAQMLLDPGSVGFRVGSQWATKAKHMAMDEVVSEHNLSTVLLLQDHDLRVGDYSSAFMLTGMATRMAQGLQLNVETRHDPPGFVGRAPWTCKEVARRMMWSVFAMDVAVSAGDDKMSMVSEDDIELRAYLPCSRPLSGIGVEVC